jgi:hypothetical protein
MSALPRLLYTAALSAESWIEVLKSSIAALVLFARHLATPRSA